MIDYTRSLRNSAVTRGQLFFVIMKSSRAIFGLPLAKEQTLTEFNLQPIAQSGPI